jgi:hypothetical protein
VASLNRSAAGEYKRNDPIKMDGVRTMTEWLQGIGNVLVGIGWIAFVAAVLFGRIKISIGPSDEPMRQ